MDYRNIHFIGSARATKPAAKHSDHPVSQPADPLLDPFLCFLLESAGIDSAYYRPEALNRRLPHCLRALRAPDSTAARAQLLRHPALLPKALSALLLGVTQFCRDSKVFTNLAERVLPDLLSRMRNVRIWSAACSDGQELYSVAILLSRLNGLERAQLLGTDCRPDAISRACRGEYSASLLASLDSECRVGCFERVSDVYLVRPEIRQHIRWEVADLMQRNPAGMWDLVLWRNMAIYLRPEAADRLWRQIAGCLSPGGYLVVGRAERPPADSPLRRVESCIYQKPALEAGRAEPESKGST